MPIPPVIPSSSPGVPRSNDKPPCETRFSRIAALGFLILGGIGLVICALRFKGTVQVDRISIAKFRVPMIPPRQLN